MIDLVFKRFSNFLGKVSGKILVFSWHSTTKILFYIGVGLFILIGILLTFLGNVIILFLGFFLTVLVYSLKGFSWFTYQVMVTTKWASAKVSDYTDSFFEGVTSVFKKEEEYLEREINVILKTENIK